MAEISIPKPSVRSQGFTALVAGTALIEVQGLSLSYGASPALKNISLNIQEKVVTAFIGPSGCGKSTLLRCFNRMNDLIDSVRTSGTIRIASQDINGPDVDVIELR